MTKDSTTMDDTMPEDEIIDLLEVVRPGKIPPPDPNAGDDVDFSADIESMLEDLAKHEAQAAESAGQPFPDPTPVNHKVDPDEELDLPDTASFDALLESLGTKAMPAENGQHHSSDKTGDDLDLPSPNKDTGRRDIPIDIEDLPMHDAEPAPHKPDTAEFATSASEVPPSPVPESDIAGVKADKKFEASAEAETTGTTLSPAAPAETADSSTDSPVHSFAAELSSAPEPSFDPASSFDTVPKEKEMTSGPSSPGTPDSRVASDEALASQETGQTHMSFTPLRAYTAGGKTIVPQFMEEAGSPGKVEPDTASAESLPAPKAESVPTAQTDSSTETKVNADTAPVPLNTEALADLIAYPFHQEISQSDTEKPAMPLAAEPLAAKPDEDINDKSSNAESLTGKSSNAENSRDKSASAQKPEGSTTEMPEKDTPHEAVKETIVPPKPQVPVASDKGKSPAIPVPATKDTKDTEKTAPETTASGAPSGTHETNTPKPEKALSKKNVEVSVNFPKPLSAKEPATPAPKPEKPHRSAGVSGAKTTSLDQVDLNELDALLDDMLATAPPAGTPKKGHKPKHRTDMEEEFIPAVSKPSVAEAPLSDDTAQRLQEFEDGLATLHARCSTLEEKQETDELDFRSVQQKLLVSQSELVEQEVAPLHKALQGAQMQMKELLETLEEKNTVIDSMQATMQEQGKALSLLETMLEGQAKTIAALETTSNALESADPAQHDTQYQDAAFTALQARLDKIETTIESAAAVAAAKVIREEIAALLLPEDDS